MSFETMVKRYSAISMMVLLCFSAVLESCGQNQNNTHYQVNYSFPFEFDRSGRMVVSASIAGNVYDGVFDTGSTVLLLDNQVIQNTTFVDSIVTEPIVADFPLYGTSVHISKYAYPIDVVLGKDTLHYEYFAVGDIVESCETSVIIPFPQKDNRIWIVDYERQMITIQHDSKDVIPSDISFSSNLKFENGFLFCSIPFEFVDMNMNTYSCSLKGALDTGSGAYITVHGGMKVFNDNLLCDFLSRNGCCKKKYDDEVIYYIDNEEVFVDKVSITSTSNSHIAVLTFGNSLLAHYCLWLDLYSNKVYACVNDKYIRPYQKHCESDNVELYIMRTDKGLLVDYCRPESSCWQAGLRQGDFIISSDGKSFENIKREDIVEYNGKSEHYIQTLRNLDTLLFVAHPIGK